MCAINVLCDVINKAVSLLIHSLVSFSPCLRRYRRTRKDYDTIKGITMAQWTNVNWNNRFINPTPLPWMSEVSGAVHLALPGLTAGRQAGRRNAGEFRKFENLL